jgi:CheY-like chemotaxis protein
MRNDLSGRELHILAIDDEPAVLEVLDACLREDGHVVEMATSGSEGWARFQTSTWDVVLTDRVMPGMNGDEIAAAIKQVSPETPVIMITGLSPGDRANKASAVDVMLRKPFTSAALHEAIDNARSLCCAVK